MINANIKYSEKKHHFMVFNNDVLVTTCKINDIIKYVMNLNISEYNKSFIEKYICKYNQSKLELVNSLIMKNLEILINLYNYISSSEINILEELQNNKIDIKIFTTLLLEHILRLLFIKSNEIANDETKKDLKIKLLKYSVFIINKLNILFKDNLIQNKNNIQVLEFEIEGFKQDKLKLKNEIDRITSIIISQNKKINEILGALNIEYKEEDYKENYLKDNNEQHIEDNEDNNNYQKIEEGLKLGDSIEYLTPK